MTVVDRGGVNCRTNRLCADIDMDTDIDIDRDRDRDRDRYIDI